MSVKSVTQTEFAGLCAVTKAAVSKAVARGMVTVRDSRVPLNDPANRFYQERALQRAVDKILTTGEVRRGWGALCFIDGRKNRPACLYPPSGKEVIDIEDDVEGDLDHGKIIVNGVEYRAAFVYDKESPPPWLDAPESEVTPKPATGACRKKT